MQKNDYFETEFKSGLTWRTISAILLTALIFIPLSIYLNLLLGTGLGSAATMFITLLFVQITRLTYKPLSRQETLLVYYGASVGGVTGVIYQLIIYRAYFIHSPFAWAAKLDGSPLALLVPKWMVPPVGSQAHYVRTLFQPEFLTPVAIYTIILVLGLFADLSLAMLMARIYVVEERYPFPFADVDISLVRFLSEKQPRITKLVLFSMLPGIIYGFFIYIGPSILGIQLIPIPFLDLTWVIRDYLPGAALGISTYLMAYIGGFMVPFQIAASLLITSCIIWVVLNSLFITTFPTLFPEWAKEYFTGMGLIAIQNRSFIRVWFAPQIGFSLGAALFMAYKSRKGLTKVLKTMLMRSKESSSGSAVFPSAWILMSIYLLSTSISVLVFHILVPTLPLWVPIFASIAYSFLLALVLTAMQGETGYTITPAYLWQTLVYLTPYKGYEGFTFTPAIVGTLAPGFSQQVRAALRIGVKPSDLVKLIIMISVISWIMGLFSLDMFWRIAPIPSSAYPYTVYYMPLLAQIDVVTVTRQLRITPEYIFVPMIVVLAVSFFSDIFSKLFMRPFSPIGFFMGLFWTPTAAIPLFIGSMIGRFIMPRFFGGKDRWEEVRGIIVAGEMLGEGITLIGLISSVLIAKSSWLWPW